MEHPEIKKEEITSNLVEPVKIELLPQNLEEANLNKEYTFDKFELEPGNYRAYVYSRNYSRKAVNITVSFGNAFAKSV